MNTKSAPSRYRYCISRLSSRACSTFSAARNVRSTTAPERTFLRVVRTNAPPLPGFTCWNSTTWKRLPSSSRVMPFLRSLVEMAMSSRDLSEGACSAQDGILRGERQGSAAVVGHDDGVLDPHATVLGKVHARLDGHDLTDAQRRLGGARDPGCLVDLEADAVAGAVNERVAPPRRLDDRSA